MSNDLPVPMPNLFGPPTAAADPPDHEPPAETSPTIGTEPPTEPPTTMRPDRRRSALPWALVGVCAAGGLALGVLWVGASGRADRNAADRDEVRAQLDSTIADLADAQAELDGANEQLAVAEDDNERLRRQLEDAEATIDEVLAHPPLPELSDETARVFGDSILTDTGATLSTTQSMCLGRAVYTTTGIDNLLQLFSLEEPPADTMSALFDGLLQGVDECGISRNDLFPAG